MTPLHDDDWIKSQAEELKAELLERAKRGEPRPKPGTLLARALELFTSSNVIYRPVGNDFLDDCQPQAFWLSKAAADRDFPESETKAYSPEEVEAYCRIHNLTTDKIELHG